MTHRRHAAPSTKSEHVRKSYGRLICIQMVSVLHREHLPWDINLGMLGVEASLFDFTAHPLLFPAILLLRTHAVHSGSKRATIPLSIFYAVRPWDVLVGDTRNSPCPQVSVVAGIIITWCYLHTTHCEQLPSSRNKHTLTRWNTISRSAARLLV